MPTLGRLKLEDCEFKYSLGYKVRPYLNFENGRREVERKERWKKGGRKEGGMEEGRQEKRRKEEKQTFLKITFRKSHFLSKSSIVLFCFVLNHNC